MLGDPPADVTVMTEQKLIDAMAAFIREEPRSWKEILEHFLGQPYRPVYQAFRNLRQLGRVIDPPYFTYTFSDSDFVDDVPEPPPAPAGRTFIRWTTTTGPQ